MLIQARNAEEFGIEVGDVKVNFGKVMERMRRLRASISPNDSCKRFASELGVDVYQVGTVLWREPSLSTVTNLLYTGVLVNILVLVPSTVSQLHLSDSNFMELPGPCNFCQQEHN